METIHTDDLKVNERDLVDFSECYTITKWDLIIPIIASVGIVLFTYFVLGA